MAAMDAGAIETASAATTASYRSFADATGSVLDLLERHLPDTTLLLSHLDRGHNVHRIVDARGGGGFGLQANQATPLRESFCGQMADDLAPRRCDDIGAHPVYRRVDAHHQHAAGSYLGVPLELSDRSRVGSLAALSRSPGRFREEDEQLFAVLARVLSSELERESSTRDLRRMSESLRDHARGLAALGRVTRGVERIARRAARGLPRGLRGRGRARGLPARAVRREFVSTAMVGVDIAPVTIQPRPEAEPGARAFTARQSYFVADARSHPALSAPLVEATSARSALFEPVLRGEQVAGVLILIWRHAVDAVPDAVADLLRRAGLAGGGGDRARGAARARRGAGALGSADRPAHAGARGTRSCRARSPAPAAASRP